ncbi:hypothetical protein KKC59_04015, partial [bacterium]|nr:hypothetical protein [bacterium]
MKKKVFRIKILILFVTVCCCNNLYSLALPSVFHEILKLERQAKFFLSGEVKDYSHIASLYEQAGKLSLPFSLEQDRFFALAGKFYFEDKKPDSLKKSFELCDNVVSDLKTKKE